MKKNFSLEYQIFLYISIRQSGIKNIWSFKACKSELKKRSPMWEFFNVWLLKVTIFTFVMMKLTSFQEYLIDIYKIFWEFNHSFNAKYTRDSITIATQLPLKNSSQSTLTQSQESTVPDVPSSRFGSFKLPLFGLHSLSLLEKSHICSVLSNEDLVDILAMAASIIILSSSAHDSPPTENRSLLRSLSSGFDTRNAIPVLLSAKFGNDRRDSGGV